VPINQAKEEEFEKRLNAEVVAGNRIISIDNCNDPLDSSFMCTQLTEETVGVRKRRHLEGQRQDAQRSANHGRTPS
jgi:hypothetical protein